MLLKGVRLAACVAVACGLCLGVSKAQEVPPVPVGGLPALEPGDYLPQPLFLNQDRVLRDYAPHSGTETLHPSPDPIPNPWWVPTPARPGPAVDDAPPFQVMYQGEAVSLETAPILKDAVFYIGAIDLARMMGLIVQRDGGGVRYFVDGYYLGLHPGKSEVWYQSLLEPTQEGVVFVDDAPMIVRGRLMVPVKDVAPYLGLKLSYDKARRRLNVDVGEVIATFSPGPRFQGVHGY